MFFTTHDAILVMVWECISVYGTGHVVVVDGNLNGFEYISTLEEILYQSVGNMFGMKGHTFIFHDTNVAPHQIPLVVTGWKKIISTIWNNLHIILVRVQW